MLILTTWSVPCDSISKWVYVLRNFWIHILWNVGKEIVDISWIFTRKISIGSYLFIFMIGRKLLYINIVELMPTIMISMHTYKMKYFLSLGYWWYVCACVYVHLRPEESIRSCGAGVTFGCTLPSVGTRSQTLVSAVVSSSLNLLSPTYPAPRFLYPLIIHHYMFLFPLTQMLVTLG